MSSTSPHLSKQLENYRKKHKKRQLQGASTEDEPASKRQKTQHNTNNQNNKSTMQANQSGNNFSGSGRQSSFSVYDSCSIIHPKLVSAFPQFEGPPVERSPIKTRSQKNLLSEGRRFLKSIRRPRGVEAMKITILQYSTSEYFIDAAEMIASIVDLIDRVTSASQEESDECTQDFAQTCLHFSRQSQLKPREFLNLIDLNRNLLIRLSKQVEEKIQYRVGDGDECDGSVLEDGSGEAPGSSSTNGEEKREGRKISEYYGKGLSDVDVGSFASKNLIDFDGLELFVFSQFMTERFLPKHLKPEEIESLKTGVVRSICSEQTGEVFWDDTLLPENYVGKIEGDIELKGLTPEFEGKWRQYIIEFCKAVHHFYQFSSQQDGAE